MRGWSYHISENVLPVNVIPANAGVILKSSSFFSSVESYPRECGGDPTFIYFTNEISRLSPRMRGWSSILPFGNIPGLVIPANAGVILDMIRLKLDFSRLSPRMRGWSLQITFFFILNRVIPANAGVILTYLTMSYIVTRYPRECGGDPTLQIL